MLSTCFLQKKYRRKKSGSVDSKKMSSVSIRIPIHLKISLLSTETAIKHSHRPCLVLTLLETNYGIRLPSLTKLRTKSCLSWLAANLITALACRTRTAHNCNSEWIIWEFDSPFNVVLVSFKKTLNIIDRLQDKTCSQGNSLRNLAPH